MNDGVLLIVAGTIGLFWLHWYVPKAMSRLGQLLTSRGQSRNRLDNMLRSATYRVAITAMTLASVIAVGVGIFSLVAS